ncbi:putative mediator of RNA polymerase II transcription subunit 26c [Acorus calamus]|uniref:Mediator of RNA polymerase II transcription subunit 26c n=1 Tax=Acorus calamus TaxID=4465 RepID=A0AAV9DHX8_ACOCL|nr:putative mediator of RNA polymerase II transcription subunit 26c [Acorus calamus]
MMDLDDLRSVLINSGLDLWDLIDAAVSVAAADHPIELRSRRDGIVERLYAPPLHRPMEAPPRSKPPPPPPPHVAAFNGGGSPSDEDQEQIRILYIKERIEDPDQSEEYLCDHLQSLADMDITFKALKETDIGRHVNRLRKHPSSEVRRLVKQLVRKWKEKVDEWVKLNPTASNAIIVDGDSPQQNPATKNSQNGNQVFDLGHSPNPQNGNYFTPEKINPEPDFKPKSIQRRESSVPPKPSQNHQNQSTSAKAKEQQDSLMDPERLASARRRLHENYQEAQNAKKQRTIQVMGIHELPKQKNTFFSRNKGSLQANKPHQHW